MFSLSMPINLLTLIYLHPVISYNTTPSLHAAPPILLSNGKQRLMVGYWWLTVFPGGCIVLMVLSANILGDWLRVFADSTGGNSTRLNYSQRCSCYCVCIL